MPTNLLQVGTYNSNGTLSNEIELPTPSEFQVNIMDISKAERNAKGTLSIERVTTKRKLEMSYQYLSAADLKTILDAINSVTFGVRYPDPKANGLSIRKFYVGDRRIGMLDYKNSVPRYKDVSFNFIEV